MEQEIAPSKMMSSHNDVNEIFIEKRHSDYFFGGQWKGHGVDVRILRF